MSQEIFATPASVAGMTVTDDGQFALIEFKTDSQPLQVALRELELMPLMALLSQASGRLQVLQKKDPAKVQALAVEWWEIQPQKGSDNLIVNFRLPGGMSLSFQLGKAAGQPMIEALQTALKGPAAPPAGAKRH